MYGRDELPEAGVLLIPNRLSFRDMLMLERELGGSKIVYLIDRDSEYDDLLRAHLDKEGVEAIEFVCEDEHLDALKKEIHGHIGKKEMVVLVPGEAVARCAQTTCVPSSTLKFLTSLGAPLMPLFVDYHKETALTVESVEDTDRVVFSFGKMIEREAVTVSNYMENLLMASEQAFSHRPILKSSLNYVLLQGLKKHGSTAKVIDGMDGGELGFDKVFAAAAAFSKYLRQATDKKRVGILLPPGKGGLIANLAVLFAGKIPVNLNFTAAAESVNHAIQEADLDRFITAGPFVEKLEKFPWPPEEQLIKIEKALAGIKGKVKLWFLIGKLFSAKRLAKMLKIPVTGDHEEAMLLFTSGSSGNPKGVVLSHRNLLANVNQFGSSTLR